ncbi:MAG: ABC transporter ATP-binding protein [Planctomycetota bacterium]|nr:ABC transporter ATP-binding protein [Planctomycetota bacterium]MDA1138246.1 ABC transporter ATP-binding protein [Planctomycetota bacterium]
MKIELRNVSLRFDGKPVLLRDVNLIIEKGEFLLIRGPSGCGKTSLLRLLNRLAEPDGGEIVFDGNPSTDDKVTSLRRRIAYVQQTPVMLEGRVRENLQFGFGFRSAENRKFADDAELKERMDRLSLDEVSLDDIAAKLSVGQQQRVALIRSMLTQPEVMLCDEPTSALDPESARLVENSIERMCFEQGVSVVMVTHRSYQPEKVKYRVFEFQPGRGFREVTL